MSSETSLSVIAICQLLLIVSAIALVGVVVWAVLAFKKLVKDKLDELMGKVDPVLDQAKSVAEKARETADSISEKLDSIATKADDTVANLTESVESVSNKLEEAMTPQVVTVGSVIGAAAKCVELFKDVATLRKTAKESVAGEERPSEEPEPE
ncbi:MAG: hypothetical protein A2Z18_03210 [Armatimonadetes bacterium RBG_16_58_9]|nr:MAG: hypothetical protein A2Z18_03210 [Armatimonadetes bacterium RBG_16_58_9]